MKQNGSIKIDSTKSFEDKKFIYIKTGCFCENVFAFAKREKNKRFDIVEFKSFLSLKSMPHICLDIQWILFDHGKALIEFITVLDYESM